MSESVQMAIVGVVGTAFGIFCTKGVDALIRWRQAEGAMEMSSENNLRIRIVHLESVVEALQKENAVLQRQLGRMESHIELLQGRVDKAKLPQMDAE